MVAGSRKQAHSESRGASFGQASSVPQPAPTQGCTATKVSGIRNPRSLLCLTNAAFRWGSWAFWAPEPHLSMTRDVCYELAGPRVWSCFRKRKIRCDRQSCAGTALPRRKETALCGSSQSSQPGFQHRLVLGFDSSSFGNSPYRIRLDDGAEPVPRGRSASDDPSKARDSPDRCSRSPKAVLCRDPTQQRPLSSMTPSPSLFLYR